MEGHNHGRERTSGQCTDAVSDQRGQGGTDVRAERRAPSGCGPRVRVAPGATRRKNRTHPRSAGRAEAGTSACPCSRGRRGVGEELPAPSPSPQVCSLFPRLWNTEDLTGTQGRGGLQASSQQHGLRSRRPALTWACAALPPPDSEAAREAPAGSPPPLRGLGAAEAEPRQPDEEKAGGCAPEAYPGGSCTRRVFPDTPPILKRSNTLVR